MRFPTRPLAMRPSARLAASLALLACFSGTACAQPPTAPGRPQMPPPFVSPDVQSDRRVTFRIYAPQAQTVRLNAGDIPGSGPGGALAKGENGVWELTLGPVDPGAYRYTFSVDGVAVADPRNPAISQSNNNVWSLVYVPGSELSDTRSVPHGAVAEVTYYSTVLSRFRRMHVYTPPGYENGKGKYPVFYLLHGASDSDDSWSSVGRAGFIIDNLIAAGKARPMIVVMPAGHTRSSISGGGIGGGSAVRADEFEQEFWTDIMPAIEKSYRALTGRGDRAIAGLSMGGAQTLNIAIAHLDKFGYVGIFSSGLFGAFPFRRPGAPTPTTTGPSPWEQQNKAVLENASLKGGLKLLWFSTGSEDFLLQTTRSTVDLLKRYGFNPIYAESGGGHTWINWRNYLGEFAPKLFR